MSFIVRTQNYGKDRGEWLYVTEDGYSYHERNAYEFATRFNAELAKNEAHEDLFCDFEIVEKQTLTFKIDRLY